MARAIASNIEDATHIDVVPVPNTFGRPHIRLSVYEQCNFRCTYCPPWGENTYGGEASPLGFDRLEAVLRVLGARGFETLKITGGEPTLSQNLLASVAVAARHMNYVSLITNAWRLTPDDLDELLRAGLTGLEIGIDAASESLFDEITQTTGMGPRVWSALEIASRLDLAVQVNSVVMRKNMHEVADIVSHCVSFGGLTVKLLELVHYEYPGYEFWKRHFVPMSAVLDECGFLTDLSPSAWISPPGSFGSPMRVYDLPNNTRVVLKDGAVGTTYANMCEPCPHFPCQDGLYGMAITYSGHLKACKHNESNHVNVALPSEDGELVRTIDRMLEGYADPWFGAGWNSDMPGLHAQHSLVALTPKLEQWYQPKRIPEEVEVLIRSRRNPGPAGGPAA